MGQVSFGTVLREARERKGYDVQSAARRLRIRPDILRALENNDFSRLPARGYTRNMVNAYARLGWGSTPPRSRACTWTRPTPTRLDARAANPDVRPSACFRSWVGFAAATRRHAGRGAFAALTAPEPEEQVRRWTSFAAHALARSAPGHTAYARVAS